MTKFSIFILFLGLLIHSCAVSKKTLTPDEYQTWYSSDKFVWKASDTINEIVYAFRYLPDEANLAACLKENCMSKNEIKELLKSKTLTYTFIFEMNSQNGAQSIFGLARPELSQSEVVTYLNGQIQKDLKAISNKKDTLACTSVIYEPMSTSKIRLLVSFESKQNICGLVLFDRIFSGYKQAFTFPELSLQSTPSLKI